MTTIDEAFGPRPPLTTEKPACKMVVRSGAIVAILVEGWSDQAALEALAHRRGLNLAAERTVILPVGGATNVGKFLDALGPPGLGVRLAGLVDANEEQYLRRALERVGLGTNLSRAGAEALGFFVCDADLEDELIRALGAPAVEAAACCSGRARVFPPLSGPTRSACKGEPCPATAVHGYAGSAQDSLRRIADKRT